MALPAEQTPEKPWVSSWACSSPASRPFHSLLWGRTCAPPSSAPGKFQGWAAGGPVGHASWDRGRPTLPQGNDIQGRR